MSLVNACFHTPSAAVQLLALLPGRLRAAILPDRSTSPTRPVLVQIEVPNALSNGAEPGSYIVHLLHRLIWMEDGELDSVIPDRSQLHAPPDHLQATGTLALWPEEGRDADRQSVG